MKKLFALLLALCLLCTSFALAETGETTFYTADFANDAWYCRGDNAVLTVTEDGLLITGRKAKSDTPAIELPMQKGMLYTVTVEVMQDSKNASEFSMSVEHKHAGNASYTKLGSVKAGRGEWVTMTGEWQAEEFDSYALFITMVGDTKSDFTVRSVTITYSDPSNVTAVVIDGDMPILKDVYAGSFDFGTCFSQADAHNSKRSSLVASQYNIITPENELKPDSVLDVTASRRLAAEDDTAVAVHFTAATPILNFARNNGLKVHGHVLVWHSQTPEAFFHVGYDVSKPYVSREVMLARLENYIRLVFEYMDANYPGLIVSWDVANECIADGSSSLRESNWTRVVGNDFVARAFEYADKYAPADVKLYYNDYSIPYEPKTTGIMNLLAELAAEGHIDGCGFQSHYSSDSPSVEDVRKAFDRVLALGLRLRISELDITVKADTDATRAQQAAQYKALMGLYIEYADQIDAVQVWGVSDGVSWIREKFPLIFDANLNPKPAFVSIVEAAEEANR